MAARPDAGSGLTAGDGQAEAAKAIESLRWAIAAGWNRPAQLKSDPDLDPVRSRPDFQLLLLDLAVPNDPFARPDRVGQAAAESCTRKAVAECGLNLSSSALRMQRRRTKPLRGGPTAPSPMEIERPDSRPLDAPEGLLSLQRTSWIGRVESWRRRARPRCCWSGTTLPGTSVSGCGAASGRTTAGPSGRVACGSWCAGCR